MESLSSTSFLAARMLAAHYPTQSHPCSHPEEPALLATASYRFLKPQVDQMPPEHRAEWEAMLNINSHFQEAAVLLHEISDSTSRTIKKLPITGHRQESMIQRLQSVRKNILNLQEQFNEDLTKLYQQRNHNVHVEQLLKKHEEILQEIDTTLSQTTPTGLITDQQTTQPSQPAGSKPNSFERFWSHPLFSRPMSFFARSAGMTAQISTFIHKVKAPLPPMTGAGINVRPPSNFQAFGMSLGACFLSLAYTIPLTLYSMYKTVKTFKEARALHKELRAGKAQLAQFGPRLEVIQRELIEQRIRDRVTPSYWAEHLSQERNALLLEEQALKTKLSDLEMKLREMPLTGSLALLASVGGLAESSAKVLGAVSAFFAAGFSMSASAMASMTTALQFIGPIAGGISVFLSGGMLVKQSKQLHNLKRANQQLKQQIIEAETKMNPQRLLIKKEMERIRAQLAIKNLSEAERHRLNSDLDQKLEALKQQAPADVIEHFNELELDRLNIELMANQRQLGLIGLGVANSTLLTLGGLVGCVASLGLFALPVSLTLGAIILGILAISLILSIVQIVKEKRSAKALEVQQRPLRLSPQELQQQSELLDKEFKAYKIKDISMQEQKTKQHELNRIWDALCAKDPTLNALPREAMRDPQVMKAPFSTYFNDLKWIDKPEAKPQPLENDMQ